MWKTICSAALTDPAVEPPAPPPPPAEALALAGAEAVPLEFAAAA